MPVILALDQSTSATKALIFDTNGTLIDRTSVDHEQHYPNPGWVEHDAEEIYGNTLKVLDNILERNAKLKHDLLCLSVTNQRETIVVFERATGRPLYRAIVWQCRRGDPICSELIDAGHSAQVQKATGLKIDTYFPAPKLKWLVTQYPEIKQKLAAGEALVGTIDTYLIYRLTGGRVFATDHTNASRTLLYDIGNLKWDDGLCTMFGVPLNALAEVRESSARYGETDLGGLLDDPIPICGVMGDSQAALFAEHCFTPGSAKVTFGTGSSVLLNIGNRFKLSDKGVVTTIGWVYQNRITYAFEGIINFTGATIAWLTNQLQLIDNPAETDALAQSIQDNDGVYLVPAFVGLSAPYWRSDVQAAILGLTPDNTKAHVARAALESIAYQIRDVLDLMETEAEIALQHIHGDGGMVKNQFLMQFVADMTGHTVRASQLPELSALGAVMSGLLGMEISDSLMALDKLEHQSVDFHAAMSNTLREQYYAGWKKAVQQIL